MTPPMQASAVPAAEPNAKARRAARRAAAPATPPVAAKAKTPPPAVAKNAVVPTESVEALLEKLRAKPAVNVQKGLRRKLRALGHRGGLRVAETPEA